MLSFSVAVLTDYDSNDNGLIEVNSLAQLNAIRYDRNGNGKADNTADDAKYAVAFPNPAAGMGCQDTTAGADPGLCIGCELTQSLDLTPTATGQPIPYRPTA